MQVCIARQSVSKSITTRKVVFFCFCFVLVLVVVVCVCCGGGIKSDITTYVEIKSV